jgi:hypothetical protein
MRIYVFSRWTSCEWIPRRKQAVADCPVTCRRGSVVEQLFRKQQVTGSNPVVGLKGSLTCRGPFLLPCLHFLIVVVIPVSDKKLRVTQMLTAFTAVTWSEALREFLLHVEATRAKKTHKSFGFRG